MAKQVWCNVVVQVEVLMKVEDVNKAVDADLIKAHIGKPLNWMHVNNGHIVAIREEIEG